MLRLGDIGSMPRQSLDLKTVTNEDVEEGFG